MEKLCTSLNAIKACLEQIQVISQNQTTVLLDDTQEANILDMLEQMFTYKEIIMNELGQAESVFGEQYQELKESLEGRVELITLQKEIGYVLELKEEIMAIEQRNLLLMGDKRRRKVEKIELPENLIKVVEAYKKHTKPAQ